MKRIRYYLALTALPLGLLLPLAFPKAEAASTKPGFATCVGADPCAACKNCKYCKRCSTGLKCGVCK